VWGKGASNPNISLDYYNIATDAWVTVLNNFNTGQLGHIYGRNTFDPVNNANWFWPAWGGHAAAIKLDSATGAVVNSPVDTGFNGAQDDQPYFGAGYHPHLYGTNDGGHCEFTATRLLVYRPSNQTWNAYSLPINIDNTGSYGAAEYMANQNALFWYRSTQ